jgi:23S rRNA pseudouridine1911/1915/1917 synthase
VVRARRAKAGGAGTEPVPALDLEAHRPDGFSEGAILRVLAVPAEAAGRRLDVFVTSQLKRTSRTRAQVIIESGAYHADGRRLRPNDRVREGDRILLWREPFEEPGELPPLNVLYEDEHLLVIDKPPLVAVHPTARYHHHTVIKRLRVARPDEFVALVHRIDRETSGILLVARSLDSERAFKRMLEDRTLRGATAGHVGKTYLAITRGVPEGSRVDLPLELDVENSLRVKMRVAAPGSGLAATTGIEVTGVRSGYALVRCELHTGRQHQIRVHLAALGCPIVGDKLYGADERLLARAADGELTDADRELLELPRHALHAHRYALTHPLTGAPLDLVSPLPRDLQEFWDALPSSPGPS